MVARQGGTGRRFSVNHGAGRQMSRTEGEEEVCHQSKR